MSGVRIPKIKAKLIFKASTDFCILLVCRYYDQKIEKKTNIHVWGNGGVK